VKKNRILCVVAHPDDEVLGCGGTMAKLSKDNELYTLILGEGITSRTISGEEKIKQLKELKKQSEQANEILGVKQVFFENFPDNKFDTIPLLDIIKIVEKKIREIKPEVIYTHHHGDLNIDHQITHKAVLSATRPVGDSTVKRILSFEVLSSTEWNYQNQNNVFTPNTYIDISEAIDKKLEAMKCYKSEIRDYPHPRSLEAIEILAKKRGLEVGLNYAEAFNLIRSIE
jgi:LmbE family N-acetylglucosaminyl deacetylase